jgi:hypothetical protein
MRPRREHDGAAIEEKSLVQLQSISGTHKGLRGFIRRGLRNP